MSGRPVTYKVLTGDIPAGRFLAPPEEVLFENARLIGVDFSDQRFSTFNATGSVFEACTFDRVRIERGWLSGPRPSLYRDCHFAGTRVANPGLARFEDCKFVDAKIDDWDCYQNDFVGCHFAGRIRGITFFGSKFRSLPGMEPTWLDWYRHDNQFSGNDFQDADLESVEFLGGIQIDDQLWPSGIEYQRMDLSAGSLDRARTTMEAWPEPSRAGALEFLSWVADHHVLQRETVRRCPSFATERGTKGARENDEMWALLAAGPARRSR